MDENNKSFTTFNFDPILIKKLINFDNEYIASLTDNQLAECVYDLIEFRKNGILKSTSIVRELRKWLIENFRLGEKNSQYFTLEMTERLITQEANRRFYNRIIEEAQTKHPSIPRFHIPVNTVSTEPYKGDNN